MIIKNIKVLLLPAVLLFAIPLFAWRSIVIEPYGQSACVVNLSDSLSVRFATDSMYVGGADVELVVPIEDLSGFSFSELFVSGGEELPEEPEEPEEPEGPGLPDDPDDPGLAGIAEVNGTLFDFDGREIRPAAGIDASEIHLYSISGVEQHTLKLDNLGKGVYVLYIRGKSFKFVVR